MMPMLNPSSPLQRVVPFPANPGLVGEGGCVRRWGVSGNRSFRSVEAKKCARAVVCNSPHPALDMREVAVMSSPWSSGARLRSMSLRTLREASEGGDWFEGNKAVDFG